MSDKELVDNHVEHIMSMFRIDDAQARAAIEFVFRERRNYRQLIAEAFGFESEGVSVLAQCRALAAEMPRWVPCEEKLPEKDGDYMVVLDNGRIEAPFHFWERYKTFREDVTHWTEMPALPSPPREEAK